MPSHTPDTPIITRERVRDLCMLARTQGTYHEQFAAGGQLFILWSNALGRAILYFTSACGEVTQASALDDGRVEQSIWQAIVDRAEWLTSTVRPVNP